MQLLRFTGRLFQFGLLGLMGLAFVAVGVFLGLFAVRDALAAADRAEALTALDLAAFERAAPGSEALLEGVLSPRNPARFRDFVAYVREEYHGSDDDGDEDWREDERVTPPLLIEIAGGLAQIGNDGYSIARSHESWQDGNMLYWNGLSGEGTKRYAGLVGGRPLMAIGTLSAGREGNALHAEFVFAGTQADYIASQRETARILPFMGLIFGGVGLLLLGIAAWNLLRG